MQSCYRGASIFARDKKVRGRTSAKLLANRPTPVRLVFVAFMLLAFFLQSYATQTHIHVEPDGLILAKLQVVSHDAKKGGAPAQDNPNDCPLCQLLYGGQYVAPTALIFFLPMVAVSVIEAVQAVLPHYDAASHNWLGRAPPRH
jgi:hypothetical protein